jgi:hypothetical protein
VTLRLFDRLDEAEREKTPRADIQAWIECKLTLITPLLGGGAVLLAKDLSATRSRPIRGKQVKASMRRFWRLLAESGQLPEQANAWSGRDLYEQERLRFGGFATDGSCAQPWIRVRVSSDTLPHPSNWASVPDYVAGVFGAEHNRTFTPIALTGWSLLCIEIAGTEDPKRICDELLSVLRWLHSFGGVGMRWRRGAGKLAVAEVRSRVGTVEVCVPCARITEKEADSAGCSLVWAAKAQTAPEIAWKNTVRSYRHFRQGHEANKVGGAVKWLLKRHHPVNEATVAKSLESGMPVGSSCAARHFGELRVQRYRPGRSCWPDWFEIVFAIRRAYNGAALWPPKEFWEPTRFSEAYPGLVPKATFGLPITANDTLRFLHSGVLMTGSSLRLVPLGASRMASPLWLGVAEDQCQFRSYALLLPTRYCQEALSTEVEVIWAWKAPHQESEEPVPESPLVKPTLKTWKVYDAVDASSHPQWKAGGHYVKPMRDLAPDAPDPLQAFMQFFRDWMK